MKEKDRDLNKLKNVRQGHTEFRSMSEPPHLKNLQTSSHMSLQDELKKEAERKLEKIKNNPSINENSKKIFLKYLEYKLAENISNSRYFRIIYALAHVLENFKDVDFSTLTQEQANQIWLWINQQNWKEWTKVTNGRVFKNFVKWLNKTYNLKIDMSNWKASEPKNSLLPESLLTEEEFTRLFNATDDLQERVLLGLLYETGARIGEILSLRIVDVSFNDYGARILVRGKTGQRPLLVVWFSSLLKQFLMIHPFGNNPQAFLFYYKNSKGQIVPMKYYVLRMRLKRLCEKAGINKRIHPHLFRHSRLTALSKEVSEEVLKRLAGWSPSSRMPQVYVHLSMRDVEEALLKVYGIDSSQNEKKQTFIKCWRCGEFNLSSSKTCWRCGAPLSGKEALVKMLSEEEVNEWAELLLEFFKRIAQENPKIWETLKQIIKEKGKENLLKK